MTEGNPKKLKTLYLMEILLENTDEDHPMTMDQILSSLRARGVDAERKSIYSDIENLRCFGLDIVGEKTGKAFSYYAASREFELAELKLLVDSVKAARFISEKRSSKIIEKLEKLTSRYRAGKLQRQVFVADRVKTENETILYTIDVIHEAIAEGVQISFQYFNWDVKKRQVLRRDGQRYRVSPWALSWDDENYYLIGYDAAAGQIRHYRVDKMLRAAKEKEPREGRETFRSFDMASYSRKVFGMFAGEERTVRLLCRNDLAGVIIDRFGRDVMMVPEGEEHFSVSVRVALSLHFLHWVFSLGEGVRITGPEEVLSAVRKEVGRLRDVYGED